MSTRDRSLATSDRAGSWARRQARLTQRAYAKRHARTIALFLAGMGAMSLLLVLLPLNGDPAAPMAMLLTSAIWLAVIFVIVGSGSASTMMGDLGEQWTAAELRRLERAGWRILNHALLREGGDIDHIAIGPPGVFVIETKWSAEWKNNRYCTGSIGAAIAQARKGRHDVWLTAKSKCGAAPVRGAVALWSALP